MLRSTTFINWLISLFGWISGKMKLVSVLVLLVRAPAAVYHCPYCLVFFIGSLSDLSLVRIDSLAPESTRALTSRVLECLYLLPAGVTILTKIIGLKCMCLGFLLDLVCLFLLAGFWRVFNRWSSCNALSKLLELSVCYLIFDLLLFFTLSTINPSLQPLSQIFYSLPMELLLLS